MVNAKRRALMIALWLGPSLVFMSFARCVFSHYHIEQPSRLGPDARAAVMSALRTVVEGGEPARPAHAELERRLNDRGPLVATVWLDGVMVARVTAHGDTAAEAGLLAARLLQEQPALQGTAPLTDPAAARRSRIKVDLVSARGPLRDGDLRAASLNPGKEGVGVTLDGGREVLLLPEDMVRNRLLQAKQPAKWLRELRAGFDFDKSDQMLARFAALPAGGYGMAKRSYFRFRVDAFVERAEGERGDGPPLALTRNFPDGPPPTAENLRKHAILGGQFLVGKIAPSGRYVYESDLASGHMTDPDKYGAYSLPRHAGTTYFLAELYRHTGEEFLREPIERAFGHLVDLVNQGGCTGTLPNGRAFACVTDRGSKRTGLGSTALTVVALAEYRRATNDPRYDELAKQLTEWILFMQREDGSFRHMYDIPSATPIENLTLLYYSGESALALARMYEVFGDPRYLEATEKALDWLVDWYDFFVGGFIYGEEHWTCIASEAAWPALKKRKYLDFCNGYAAFLRRQQPQPGEYPRQEDLAGAYGFTPFWVPNNTPAGSRSEAMISTYLLGVYHGEPQAEIRDQILHAMHYVLRQQTTSANDWSVPIQVDPLGSVPSSAIDRNVRIDFVQHVCSAMIRTAALLEE